LDSANGQPHGGRWFSQVGKNIPASNRNISWYPGAASSNGELEVERLLFGTEERNGRGCDLAFVRYIHQADQTLMKNRSSSKRLDLSSEVRNRYTTTDVSHK
jgi:hypothetical protein